MGIPFSLLFFCFLILQHLFKYVNCISTAVWAVNCGGQFHVDVNGVEYMNDPLSDGIASPYGMQLRIRRVPEEDMILYQTERYSLEDFSYEIPRPVDGNYVLNLKFSEVWFHQVDGKVFDVSINEQIKIISNLDIFKLAGFSVAYDEFVPLSIKDDMLTVAGSTMNIADRESITINFQKGSYDNPKVNAIVLFKGTLEDVPQMPHLELEDDQEQEIEEDEQLNLPPKEESESRQERERTHTLGAPAAPDPYASLDTSYVLPLIITMCTFIPILFCLCKL